MGLQQSIRSEKVGDLNLLEPIKVGPDLPIRRAIEDMRQRKLGCVIIVDADDKPQGMFTERMLIKLLPRGAAFLDQPVSRYMSEFWAVIRHNESISNVIHKMRNHGLRFICVVDDDGKVVGLTGQKSVMRYLADHFPRQVKVQMLESKLYMDQREGA